MRALLVLAVALSVLAPVVVFYAAVSRSPRYARQAPLLVSASATGLAAAVVAAAIERFVLRLAELEPSSRAGTTTWFLYSLAVAAPLEMALTTSAVAPYWTLRRARRSERWRERPTEREGVVFAGAAAVGLGAMRHALLAVRSHALLDAARLLASGFAFPLLAALWGYSLGKDPERGLRARNLGAVWLGSVVFLAVLDDLLLRRGALALLAGALVLGGLAATVAYLWRDPPPAVAPAESTGRLSLLFSAPAPSIGAIREAFRQEDRPLTMRWLAIGVLVNAGAMLTGLVVAVLLGRRVAVDFAAVDRPDAGAAALGPVSLLALGALAAFPVAGFLVARAAGTRSVLEPALSSAFAMLVLLVVFGLLAPSSLVFVIAVTPVAFALSCAGAWFGIAR
ncbi:MAG: protease PrsW [Deltaproteobacteria bacterium]|nr:protease PrsW [Deltaproteobacteria bacterium]